MYDELEVALRRRNPSATALGNIRRYKLFRNSIIMYKSPDQCTWLIPTFITLILLLSCIYISWNLIIWWEFIILMILIGIALISSFLVTSTDPGVYPRLGYGEVDPLEHAGPGYGHCRVCKLRRPPRTAHCYICNVCVLEHDHHCGVLGGCVGIRSLRWFTLYLLSVSSACVVGCVWLLLGLFGRRRFIIIPNIIIHNTTSMVRRMASTTTVATNASMSSLEYINNNLRDGIRRNFDDFDALTTTGSLVLLMFIGNVAIVVGGLGLYYFFLMCRDTTRREAQGKGLGRVDINYMYDERYTGIFAHLKKTMYPPSSMLEIDKVDGDVKPSYRDNLHIV